MRGGVCCHRGLSAASVSYSGARDGVVVEKLEAHAEVRTRAGLEVFAHRSDGAGEEKRLRVARFDAIVAGVWLVAVRCAGNGRRHSDA